MAILKLYTGLNIGPPEKYFAIKIYKERKINHFKNTHFIIYVLANKMQFIPVYSITKGTWRSSIYAGVVGGGSTGAVLWAGGTGMNREQIGEKGIRKNQKSQRTNRPDVEFPHSVPLHRRLLS